MDIVKELQEMKKQYYDLKDKCSFLSEQTRTLTNELENIVHTSRLSFIDIKPNGAFSFKCDERLNDNVLLEIEQKLNCYLYDERISVDNVMLLEDGKRYYGYTYYFMIEN